jgi:hypothetical protein
MISKFVQVTFQKCKSSKFQGVKVPNSLFSTKKGPKWHLIIAKIWHLTIITIPNTTMYYRTNSSLNNKINLCGEN